MRQSSVRINISQASDVEMPAFDSLAGACASRSAAIAMSDARRKSPCSAAVTIAAVRKRVTERKRPKSGGTTTASAGVLTDLGYVAIRVALETRLVTRLFAGFVAKNFARSLGLDFATFVKSSVWDSFALNFSSFEYFWLVLLGLTCAVFVSTGSPVKGLMMLFLGLLVACVGLGNPAGFPRFTFGSTEMSGGIGMIAMMIGMFAISEIIRYVVDTSPPAELVVEEVGGVLKGQWALAKKYPKQILRGSVLGTAVGALPGAGADIAAWMSYAMSKKFSKEPEKFGTGHVEGIVESGSANNSALAGAWIPALVFGIPGDSITAIVIGVLYMKNMNPGPTLFTTNPQNIYAVFLLFIVANLIMIPLGILCIKVAKRILRVPREILMPMILLFCVVGTFAINNSVFQVGVMLVAGILAYLLEANKFPVAPAILGVVLGGMLEENFITSMIKSNGDLTAFVARPIALSLAILTALVWFTPLLFRMLRKPAPAS